MKTYAIYGHSLLSIIEAQILLEKTLDLVFIERDSLYQGGIYYSCGHEEDENFLLKRNIDLLDGEPVEPDFRDYPILLYANNIKDKLKLDCIISSDIVGFKVLRVTG